MAKVQFLNPVLVQKLNKAIVSKHFQKVEKLYKEQELHYHSERIYNMDEKGCRLSVHNQQIVVAPEGARKVHTHACEQRTK